MKAYYGSWVHISDKDDKILKPVMSDLSDKYLDGSTFPPHISVMSSRKMRLKNAKEAIDNCAKGVRTFKVKKESIRRSDKWSKTLYIQLQENSKLTKISSCLDSVFRPNNDSYPLDPHISLLYKEGMSSTEKEKLVDEIEVPETFTAKSLALVTPGNNKNNWRYYEKWEIVYECDFL